MVDVTTFAQALEAASGCKKKHLLLGNGFSIACFPKIFPYTSLYEEAKPHLPAELVAAFNTLKTTDFEAVIRALQSSAAVAPIYGGDAKKMIEHSEILKEALVKAVASRHPSRPGDISPDKYASCRKFLAHFLSDKKGNVYTTNYDLLLYWAAMQDDVDEVKIHHNDGFGKDPDDYDAEYVMWHGESKAHGQRVHYLHGALHLFDAGRQLQKYTWINTGKPLIDQAGEALSRNEFPLFVSEANSNQKLAKIQHSAYLHHSYKSYIGVINGGENSALFVLGHSLDVNDDHIFERIGRSDLGQLYVSLHGSQDSDANIEIIRRAERLKSLRTGTELFVGYYDAASAAPWG
ncbi:DUF4917 family protein [Brevundimonas aurantiaca]|uniref:DUF4917 family protein n=1 Tax=Brevundimonas aurantiaca TaxID=74316 RepID=UPI00174DC0E4|nr:DUF4917 family protein [Brevundimonas aurantiaca]